MLKNILTVLRKLASAAMNFLIVYFETIAVPMSWAMGGTIMFTMYTELSNEQMTDSICEATGAKKLLLHSCHNVSKDDFESGATYLSLMEQNVSALKEALN